MDYTESLSFAFEDPHWVRKLLIGGFLAFLGFYAGLIFLTGFVLMGYFLGVLRNVVREERPTLPEWGDLGKIIVDGILGAIIALVYVVALGAAGALYFVYIAEMAELPDELLVIAIVGGGLLLYVGLKLFIGVALLRFVATNNFSDAFNLRLLVENIRADIPALFSIVLFTCILQLILFFAGLAILSPFLNFWGFLVEAHLFGQYGRMVLVRSTESVEQDTLTARVS